MRESPAVEYPPHPGFADLLPVGEKGTSPVAASLGGGNEGVSPARDVAVFGSRLQTVQLLRSAGVFPGIVLIAPLLVGLSLVYLLPFLGVAAWSVTLPTVGLGQYEKLVGDDLVLSVFLRTARICCTVTVLAVVAAYAITYVWVRGTRLQRRLFELCILVPFWISLLTRAFGWLALLSSRGLINTWLQVLGVVDEPLQLVRNEFGVVVGMVHVLIPFAVFPLASAMRSVDERVLLAAQGLGASRGRVFWSVFLPMTMSGIAGSALITFVFTLGFFVTPAILGGGRSVMVAELVYVRMLFISEPGLGARGRHQRGAGRDRGRAHGARLSVRPAGPRREPAMTASRPGPLALLAASAVAVFLLLPLLAVVPISFTPARYLSMPHGTLSLIHYRALITNPDWLAAALLSLRIGVVTSLVSTALALAFSLGLWMLQPRFAGPDDRHRAPAHGGAAGRLGHDAVCPAHRPVAVQRSRGLRYLARRDARPCRHDGAVRGRADPRGPGAGRPAHRHRGAGSRRLGMAARHRHHPAQHPLRRADRGAARLRAVLGGDRRHAVRHQRQTP